jgi:hypothetical protein
VDWKASAEGCRLSVELPVGTTAEIHLPQDWGKRVTLDEKMIAGEDKGGVIAIDVGPGAHLIVVGR